MMQYYGATDAHKVVRMLSALPRHPSGLNRDVCLLGSGMQASTSQHCFHLVRLLLGTLHH